MFEHINALSARESFFERLKKEFGLRGFTTLQRRLARQRDRAERRARRGASYPYASKRQNARYARQIAAGQLKFA